ncbi:PhnA domain-containing protein [Glaciecola sp. MH2013]|uniref:PhnA domain-containing protein n=1 Tax=Glaciecola sp. MH2013 TaxID=2785524 RepID=UPI0018A01793|nr:alkylphosphonate utilization protein [Glaciecola sp. MH2013]MBF7074070.1 PhnA domain-containing protein [Glaciecola sp. MH2013]
MSIESTLAARSGNKCELCASESGLQVYPLAYSPDETANCAVNVCDICLPQIEANADLDFTHLRCLKDAMWAPVPAVQVLAYRLLHKCSSESWAQDALDMMYLEDDVKSWADAGVADDVEPTLDVNGVVLAPGDSVTIIKDLDVKGANFTAKRGTPVRNIGLSENPLHIEGKVNGQRIVIIAAYTKKN